jgi:hypothetical protein
VTGDWLCLASQVTILYLHNNPVSSSLYVRFLLHSIAHQTQVFTDQTRIELLIQIGNVYGAQDSLLIIIIIIIITPLP